jgi:holo-[acyl-carrier protein] synthase
VTAGAVMGVGLDIVELEEFAASVGNRPRMLERVFTPGELAYCRLRPKPIQHFAARFAAKEAAFKAVGSGWTKRVKWRDVEVVSASGGRPTLVVRGALRRLAPTSAFHVTLSHSGSYAVAVVLMLAASGPEAAR